MVLDSLEIEGFIFFLWFLVDLGVFDVYFRFWGYKWEFFFVSFIDIKR